MSYLPNNEAIIGDHNYNQYVVDQVVGGEMKSRGLVPRDYSVHPVGCYGAAAPYHSVSLPIVNQSEWSQRCRDKVAAKANLSDIRLTGNNGQIIPALDQNGKGYCWAHSSTGAIMIVRATMLLPYVPLSAYAIACIIKNYRDEGGWGAQSLDFITSRGVPSSAFWPMQSMSRANDNPKTWENAALHKMSEGWVDLQAAQYDRTLSFTQVASLLLCGVPVVGDFNWWGHSVCLLDLVDGTSQMGLTRNDSGKLPSLPEFEIIWGMNTLMTGFGVRILNSWGDSWSDRGMGVLTGNQAIPDGATAPLVTIPSAA